MVRPIILGAAASSNLLDGMKNQIRCGLLLKCIWLLNGLKQLCSWIVDRHRQLVLNQRSIPPLTRPWYMFLSALTNGQRRRTNGEWADGRFPFLVKLFFQWLEKTSTPSIYCHYGRPSGNALPAISPPSHNTASTMGISYKSWKWSLHLVSQGNLEEAWQS